MTPNLGTMQRLTGSQIRDRIRVMFGQVYKSIRWPLTRTIAVQMVLDAGCPTQQLVNVPRVQIDACQVAAIFWAVKRNGYYIGDVGGLDTYQTAQRSGELGMASVLASVVPQFRSQLRAAYQADLAALLAGQTPWVFDCDDGVIIQCALLRSIGFRVGAKCYSEDGERYGHVVAVAELPRYVEGPKQIVPLDVTEYEAYPGWEPPPQWQVGSIVFWYSEGGEG